MTEKEANAVLDRIGHDFLNSSSNFIYIAVVQNNSEKKDFLFEVGIKKKQDDDACQVESKILTLSEISKFTKLKNTKKQFSGIKKDSKIEFKNKFIEDIEQLSISDLKIRPLISGIAVNGIKADNKIGTIGAFFKVDNNLYGSDVFFITNYHNLTNNKPVEREDLIFQPNNIYKDYKNIVGNYFFGQYHDDKGRVNTTLDYAIVKIHVQPIEKKVVPNMDFEDSENPIYNLNYLVHGFINNDAKMIKRPALNWIDKPKIGMKVRYHGATSVMCNRGKIKSINAMVKLTDIFDDKKKIIFKNQILLDFAAKKGDSGSVLINEDNNIVGLLHASDSKHISIANNITEIFCNHSNHHVCDSSCKSKIKLKEILT